jgi:hypothetical protein
MTSTTSAVSSDRIKIYMIHVFSSSNPCYPCFSMQNTKMADTNIFKPPGILYLKVKKCMFNDYSLLMLKKGFYNKIPLFQCTIKKSKDKDYKIADNFLTVQDKKLKLKIRYFLNT